MLLLEMSVLLPLRIGGGGDGDGEDRGMDGRLPCVSDDHDITQLVHITLLLTRISSSDSSDMVSSYFTKPKPLESSLPP